MRKYLKYLFIPLLLIVGILAARGFYHYQKQYTGEEWFQKQESYISNLRTYVGEMDDVFALYIAGSIQEDDFLNHISVLQGELDIIQGCYKKEQMDHPVRTGTYTYEEKLGCEGVSETMDNLQEILIMAQGNSSDIDTLSYKYLALHQSIIDSMAKYTTAQVMMKAE